MKWKWCNTDEWCTNDKLIHLVVGFFVSLLTGPVGGCFLAVGKETIDAVAEEGSGFSYKDLTATLCGVVVGSIIFFLVV